VLTRIRRAIARVLIAIVCAPIAIVLSAALDDDFDPAPSDMER
jgi:hypothetical protein